MTGALEGRVAIVTGGASGIGAATARRFVEAGAQVVVADVQDERGRALASELGDAARFERVDVTQEDDIAAAVDSAVAWAGRLDVLFANAGVFGAVGPIAESRTHDVDLTIAVNLRGTLLSLKHAARVMVPAGRGSIIATASPGGIVGGAGPHTYSATKAGIIGLTRSVAAELREHGVRVNAIVPGAVVSGMTAAALTGAADDLEGVTAAMTPNALFGRPGEPDDIARAVLFLAGDDSSYMTGSELVVDAGYTHASGAAAFAKGRFVGAGALLEGDRRT